ncbi:hypothetical protein HY491_03500 [Candidatus Woesearchaeota archaeon]|nr:hypothetical protein [Candidatus Woesearchaeota archaeon]
MSMMDMMDDHNGHIPSVSVVSNKKRGYSVLFKGCGFCCFNIEINYHKLFKQEAGSKDDARREKDRRGMEKEPCS